MKLLLILCWLGISSVDSHTTVQELKIQCGTKECVDQILSAAHKSPVFKIKIKDSTGKSIQDLYYQ